LIVGRLDHGECEDWWPLLRVARDVAVCDGFCTAGAVSKTTMPDIAQLVILMSFWTAARLDRFGLEMTRAAIVLGPAPNLSIVQTKAPTPTVLF
jgi:hypothetical protein